MPLSPAQRTATPLALFLALVATSACESVDRMVRNSPFAEGLPEEDRVNLFPLAYFDGRGTALLWPLADWDDQGFAVRPLIHKEGPVVSVAYPLSNWDTELDQGWLGPYYDFGKDRGFFPLANFGQTTWIGPAWWTRQEADDEGDAAIRSWGLFPLFSQGRFSHVGPVYWADEDDDGSWDEAGLFPLFGSDRDFDEVHAYPFYSHVLSETETDRRYLMGLVRSQVAEDERTDWALPLWFRHREEEGGEHLLVPFFYKKSDAQGAHVYTLLGDRKVQGEERGLNVYPLWWSWADADSSTRMLLPFFYDETKGTDRTVLTPLGGRSWSTDGSTRFVNVLGPVFHRSHAEDRTTTTLLWPLFERRTQDETSSTRIWPLFRHTSSETGTKRGWLAAGLGAYDSDEEATSWRLWPLASSYEGSAPDPLYDLGLFEWSEREGHRQRRLYPLFSRTLEGEVDRLTLAAGLAHHHRSDRGSSTRVLPLFSVGDEDPSPDLLDHLTLFARQTGENGSYLHLGTGLGFSRRKWNDERGSTRTTGVLAMFKSTEVERKPAPVPAASDWHRENLVDRSETRLLLGSFKFQTETYRDWNADAPLSHGDRDALYQASQEDPLSEDENAVEAFDAARRVLLEQGVEASDPAEVQREALAFAEAHSGSHQRHHTRIPLLFESRRSGDHREWDALLGMAKSESDQDSSRFRLLYALYKRETVGDRTSRDLFPFVTWDSAPEQTTFSFLWRVFRYQNDHGRRSGHVLFFPWGP